MYLKTVAILTILLIVISLIFPEALPPDMGIFQISIESAIVAIILAAEVWLVWRILRGLMGLMGLKRKKKKINNTRASKD